MSLEPSSRVAAAGAVNLLDSGEIVLGQPTCFFLSGSGFSLDVMSALGSAALTLEEPMDAVRGVFVGTVSHALRRALSIDQTSDGVKTLLVRSSAGAAEGGVVSFLFVRCDS